MEEKIKVSGSEHSLNPIDKLYHICIGLLPVLYLFNVPGLNMSFGTILIILFTPHALFYVYNGLKRGGRSRISVFPFLLFYSYIMFRYEGNITGIILCLASFINLWGFSYGSIRIREIRKIIEVFALVNLVLLVLQLLVYYGAHIRITYIPRQLLHSEFQQSSLFTQSYGLYRPTALFLEPSHYSQYCCFAFISALFPISGEKPDLKRAALIGLGCILTTSGMGIGLTFGILVWYIILNQTSKGIKLFSILKWVPIIAIAVIILLQIPSFQTAIARVLSDVDGYNAIQGRTHNWDRAIGTMSGKDLWFGYGYSAKFPYYLAGLPDTIYKYGVMAVILEFLCFLYLMLKKFGNYVWCCCIVFIMLFCFAHLTSFYIQVFYFGIIIADAVIPNGKRLLRVRFCLRRH